MCCHLGADNDSKVRSENVHAAFNVLQELKSRGIQLQYLLRRFRHLSVNKSQKRPIEEQKRPIKEQNRPIKELKRTMKEQKRPTDTDLF
jgi:hypothetical protein